CSSRPSHVLCLCFFFQAEDGIRDRNVTGVQTCALPISTNNVKVFMNNTHVFIDWSIQKHLLPITKVIQKSKQMKRRIRYVLKKVITMENNGKLQEKVLYPLN